ncbi:MAG: hypothetical protein OEV92_01255 [Nitrospinota bacterium]|nr:hypothetical protein [Nitrospinota bacterium]
MKKSDIAVFLVFLQIIAILPAPAHGQSTGAKSSIVLMPLRASEGVPGDQVTAYEAALVEGLSERYNVFAGQRVREKVEEVFRKVAQTTKAGEKCDDTKCFQNIAIEFQSELIANAMVTKITGGYLLTLTVINVVEERTVFSRSDPCEACNVFQVVNRLKALSQAAPVEVARTPAIAKPEAPKPAPAPEKAAKAPEPVKQPPTEGIVNVTSDPFEKGAAIYVDGDLKSQIPAELTLPVGRHEIEVKGQKGAGKKSVEVQGGKSTKLLVKLEGGPEEPVATEDGGIMSNKWLWIGVGALALGGLAAGGGGGGGGGSSGGGGGGGSGTTSGSGGITIGW